MQPADPKPPDARQDRATRPPELAVKHGSGPLLLTLRAGTTHVYVGVVDRAPDVSATVVPPPELVSESGRGLPVVDALSTTWGTEQQAASSKLVWATVPSGSP